MAMNGLGLGLLAGGMATGLEHARKLDIEQEEADAKKDARKGAAAKAAQEQAKESYKDLREGYEGVIKNMVAKMEAEGIKPDSPQFQEMTRFIPTAIKRVSDARTAAYGGSANDNLDTIGNQFLGHLGSTKSKDMTAFADAVAKNINEATGAKLRTGYFTGVQKGQETEGKVKTENEAGVPAMEGQAAGTKAVNAAPGMGQAEAITAATGGAAATGQRAQASALNSFVTTPQGSRSIMLGGGPGVAPIALGGALTPPPAVNPGQAAGMPTSIPMPPAVAAPRPAVAVAPVAPPLLGTALQPPVTPPAAAAPPVAVPVPVAVPPPGAAAPPVNPGAPRPGMSPTETFPNGGAMPQAPAIQRLPNGGMMITQPGAAAEEQPKIIEKDLGELFVGIQQRARGLKTQMQALDRLDHTLDQVDTNKFTGTTTNLKAMAKGLGVDLNALGIKDDVAAAQAGQAAAREMALQLRNPAGGAGMPGAMSDADRVYLESMIPGLEMTRDGRKLIVEAKRQELKREAEVAAFTRDYARQRGGALDLHFEDALAQQFANRPLFSDADRERQAAATKAAETAPPPSPGPTTPPPALEKEETRVLGDATYKKVNGNWFKVQ